MASLADILEACASPQGREILGFVADQWKRKRSGLSYEQLHWGREGKPTVVEEEPLAGPLTHLGALAQIGYVTEKGGDPGPTNYLHSFDRPYPGLYVDANGLLRILRGRSRYRIGSHGIEG